MKMCRDEDHSAIPWLSVRGRNDPVHRRHCRRIRVVVAFFQGSARLFAASGLRTAGDDAGACRRRLAARRICQSAPPLFADPGSSQAGHQRVHRGGRQELLPAPRHRHLRHRPRRHALCPELRQQPPAAGRLDHHSTGRQEFPLDQRGVVRAQDQGSAAGVAHRAHVFEGQDSRALPQRNLSRLWRLRCRRGVASVFRQVGA